MAIYKTIITDRGTAKIAAAIAAGSNCRVIRAAVGDGNGEFYTPLPTQTALRREVWSGQIAAVETDGNRPNLIHVRFIVPPEVGGFTVREAALFDADGDMVAVCNLPDTLKELHTTGTVGKLTITMHIIVTDSAALVFEVNPSLDNVTWDQLTDAIAAHDADPNAHPTLRAMLDDLAGRVSILEITGGGTGITSNAFRVTFDDAGIGEVYFTGYRNFDLGRMEF